MAFLDESELNLNDQRCAIRDAAMIIARLSLIPDDGYIGSQNILSRIQLPNLASRSLRLKISPFLALILHFFGTAVVNAFRKLP